MSSLIRAVLIACILGVCVAGADAAPGEPQPIRALLITGGCCHDYHRQQHTITQGISARSRAPIQWTIVLHKGGNRVPVYEQDLASKYDIIFHNECFADEKDPAWIDKVLAPHRAGVPGVVMHCAMHSYGFGRVEPWVRFLGVRSHGHGSHYPYKVEPVAKDHPILEGFGESWQTPKGELYRVSEVMKTATPLARAQRMAGQKATGTYDVCFWTNIFEDKARVFGTTVGHHNETVETQQWMNTVARGFLWSLNKLDDDHYRAVTEHEHAAVVAKAVELAAQTKTGDAGGDAPALPGSAAGTPKSLATGKQVKASSEETGKNNLIAHGIDGKLNTRWCASAGSAPQWYEVDLGKPQHVRSVRIHWEAESGCAYRFTVSGSADGVQWKTLHDASENREHNGVVELQIDAPGTRHLRVTYLGSSTGAWGSIRELEVYDTSKLPELVRVPVQSNASTGDVRAPEGFDVTLFAAPPKVNYPVCLTVDVSGAVFVGVDPNGSLGRLPGKGHVVRCVDTDNDGVADEFTKVTDVRFPRGLFYDRGQLWVQHPPTVTLFTDNDGDGVADESRAIVTGISTDMNEKRGADHTTNGMTMGIDGWLYIAVGDFGFVRAMGTDGRTLQLYGGGVVRVRPDGSELELYARGTRNICDVAVDPYLNLFARDNTNDGGGWDVRLHHIFGGGAEHGYPSHYQNFPDEHIHPLADYGGGSGTGALYVQEPGLGKYGDALLTADWGRNAIYHHPLTRDGAGFNAEQEPFVTIPRPTDLDVDASGRMYIASWKNGGFSYKDEDVGFVARLTPKAHALAAPPDLATADDAQLLAHLASPSHSLRLYTQREILRRGEKPVFRAGLVDLMSDVQESLPVRVAAIFTLKQLLGPAANDALIRISEDATVRAFALRALADRRTQAVEVPVEPFIAGLQDDDARVRLQAAIGLGRLGKPAGAAPLVPHVADADPLVAHAAVRSLIALGAGDVALSAQDSADAKLAAGLSQVLQALHEPAVVDGLIARLSSRSERAARMPIIRALARLYHVEHEWDGRWWGTRPDTRGPYYKPMRWEQTQKIEEALTAALQSAPADLAAPMMMELMRQRVVLPAMDDVLLTMAQAGPQQRSIAIRVLAELPQVPAAAAPLLRQVALDDAAPTGDRATAVRALMEAPGDAGRDAVVAALGQMMSQDPPADEAVTAFEQYISSRRHADDAGTFAKIATSGDAGSRQVAYAVLLRIAGDGRAKGDAKRIAANAVRDAWASPASLPAVLRAVALTRDKDYEQQIRTAATSQAPAVRDAAVYAARVLRLTDVPGMNEGEGDLIAKMTFEDVAAQAMGEPGDAAEGARLFAQQGCIACHTVSPKAPPKGPMLADIGKRYSRAELIESILKPSSKIAQGFDTYAFDLSDGTTQVGFVTRESGDEIELRNIAGLPIVIKPADVDQRTKQAISLMPDGLVANLTPRQFASLLTYLQSIRSD